MTIMLCTEQVQWHRDIKALDVSYINFYLGGSQRMRMRADVGVKRHASINTIPWSSSISSGATSILTAQAEHAKLAHQLAAATDSDYDLYATDSDETRRLLKSVGFENIQKTSEDVDDRDIHERKLSSVKISGSIVQHVSRYPCEYDDETVSIWHHQASNTDVALKRNAEFYQFVFEHITLSEYIRYVWKSGPYYPARKNIVSFMNEQYERYRPFWDAIHK